MLHGPTLQGRHQAAHCTKCSQSCKRCLAAHERMYVPRNNAMHSDVAQGARVLRPLTSLLGIPSVSTLATIITACASVFANIDTLARGPYFGA